jgi:hypothetical protein
MCLIITHQEIAAAECRVVPDFAQPWAPSNPAWAAMARRIEARLLGCLLAASAALW